MGLLLQSSIELAASLNVRLSFASNDLLSVLVSFCQTPNAVFAQGRFRKRRGERPHLTVGSPKRTKDYERAAHTSSTSHHSRVRLFSHDTLGSLHAFNSAPSGMTPSSRYRHKSTRSFRAKATIPIRLIRPLPWPKRSSYHRLSLLSGCQRSQAQAI